MRRQNGTGIRVHHHLAAQRGGNGIHGDVIMGGADAAGGEQIIIAHSQRVHRFRNSSHVIGHHPHFLQADALHAQPFRQIGQVRILGAARQDFIADHQQGGGVDAFGIAHAMGLAESARGGKGARHGQTWTNGR